MNSKASIGTAETVSTSAGSGSSEGGVETGRMYAENKKKVQKYNDRQALLRKIKKVLSKVLLVAGGLLALMFLLGRFPGNPAWACGVLDQSSGCDSRVELELPPSIRDLDSYVTGIDVNGDGTRVVVSMAVFQPESNDDESDDDDGIETSGGFSGIFDTQTGELIQQLQQEPDRQIYLASFSADYTRVATVTLPKRDSNDRYEVVVQDVSTGNVISTFEAVPGFSGGLDFDQSGETLQVGSFKYDIASGERLDGRFWNPGRFSNGWYLSAGRDQPVLEAVELVDDDIKIDDDTEIVIDLPGYDNVMFSPSGEHVLVYDNPDYSWTSAFKPRFLKPGGKLAIVDADTGEPIKTINLKNPTDGNAGWAANGRFIATADASSTPTITITETSDL